MIKTLLITFYILLIYSYCCLSQQAGILDNSFDNDGKVVTSLGSIEDRAYAIKTQSNGKIVVGGFSKIGTKFYASLCRYNTDGSIDSSFGVNGKVFTLVSLGGDDKIWDLKIQNDDKIIAVGETFNGLNTDFLIIRYLPDGLQDSTFGINGIVIWDFSGVNDRLETIVIDDLNKIYVGGTVGSPNDFAIARLDSTGVWDTSFNSIGVVISDFGASEYVTSLSLQGDKKIVAVGNRTIGFDSDFILARYDSVGSIDITFANNGSTIIDLGTYLEYIQSSIIQTDGKIVLAGSLDFTGSGSNYDCIITRYNLDGTIDSSFNVDGIIINPISPNRDILTDIQLQSDNKIIVAGYTQDMLSADFIIIRYDSIGNLDNTFGTNGVVQTDFSTNLDISFGMTIQDDNKILLCGETFANNKWNFALARYYSGLEVGFPENHNYSYSLLPYPNPNFGFGIYLNQFFRNANVEVVNIYGQIIQYCPLLNGNKINFNFPLDEGVYFLNIYTKSEFYSSKFIVIK